MSARARIFTYDVSLDRDWTARSALGGAAIRSEEDDWTPEHLVLAGLCRCVLTSLRYHAHRAELEPSSSATAHGVVTRREEDGRFAFVEITVQLDVSLENAPSRAALAELVAKAERDCFIGASLTLEPDYRWNVNGEELS